MCFSNTQKMKKSEIWFLQTHLTNREMIHFSTNWEKIENQFASISLKDSLKKLKVLQDLFKQHFFDKERQNTLLNAFEKFLQTESTFENENIISGFDLSQLLMKPLPKEFPLAFQFLGNPEILKKPSVAIVGSRHPTYYGREQAQRFAQFLAQAGCTIVSGGAIGIDTIANAVAIEYGNSCAVIGSGLQKLYPASNAWLFEKMRNSNHGLVMSEFDAYTGAHKWNFPRRNHSIAMLADFVLVIEATLTSGSLITAHAAADFGVDVGAIPGNVDNPNSSGTNLLIKNGAFCIQTPEDVFERVMMIHYFRLSKDL